MHVVPTSVLKLSFQENNVFANHTFCAEARRTVNNARQDCVLTQLLSFIAHATNSGLNVIFRSRQDSFG